MPELKAAGGSRQAGSRRNLWHLMSTLGLRNVLFLGLWHKLRLVGSSMIHFLSVIGSRSVMRSRSMVRSRFVSGSWVIRSGFVSGSWVIRSGSWVVNGSGFVVDGSWFVDRFGSNIRSNIRSGSRFVHWFGSVIRSRSVVRSGLMFMNIRDDLTLVTHISNVSVFMISGVSDNLGSAVREGHTVFTGHYAVIILGFLFGKISTRVFVLNTVFIREGPGSQLLFMIRGRGVVRGRGMVGCRGGVIRGGVVGGMVGHSHSH